MGDVLSATHGASSSRRKKLQFRSWHRGTRELDLIFGTFADAAIETLDEGELDDYERLLNLPDTDLMDWMLIGKPVPADIDSALVRRILAFRQNMPF
jgi:antitoxin CptB